MSQFDRNIAALQLEIASLEAELLTANDQLKRTRHELAELKELEAYAATVFPHELADLRAELARGAAWLRDAEELPGWDTSAPVVGPDESEAVILFLLPPMHTNN